MLKDEDCGFLGMIVSTWSLIFNNDVESKQRTMHGGLNTSESSSKQKTKAFQRYKLQNQKQTIHTTKLVGIKLCIMQDNIMRNNLMPI